MNRAAVVFVLLVCVFASGVKPGIAADSRAKPNIIFILTDDQRWNTLGCMGDTVVSTPNVDKLAAKGVLFPNHFVTTSICCVSRASIFCGQYARRHGIHDFDKPFTPEQWAQTYPALMRNAGYRTGFIGKFGVGSDASIHAMAKEFDYWRGLTGQGGLFFDKNDPTQTHATARMGTQALEFLSSCEPGKPFCLSVSFTAPHARDRQPREFFPDPRDEGSFTDTMIPRSETASDEYFKKLPEDVQNSESRRRWEIRFATSEMYQRTLRDYYRLIAGIDREVGRIVEKLAELKMTENTVIVFTSDNGFFFGERGLADKWYMYEESIRVPLAIFDPRLPAELRGRKSDSMTLNIDFAPTLLELAGIPVPAAMQGRSLLPLVNHAAPPPDWRKEFFYEHHFGVKIIPPSEGVRTDHWCYLRWISHNPAIEELYEVANDPLEEHNLISDPKYAETLNELRAKWERYGTSLK